MVSARRQHNGASAPSSKGKRQVPHLSQGMLGKFGETLSLTRRTRHKNPERHRNTAIIGVMMRSVRI